MHKYSKDRNKLSQLKADMIVYIENAKESTKNFLELIAKEETWTLSLISYTKINSKWIKDPNIGVKSIKLIGKK